MGFDAGTLTSAFVSPGSAEEAAYRRILEGEVELVTSPATLWLFARVLIDGFGWDPVMAEHAVTHVARVAADVRSDAGAAG